MDFKILLEMFLSGQRYDLRYRMWDVRTGKRIYNKDIPKEYKSRKKYETN